MLYPLTFIALTWTNELHHLIWSGFAWNEYANNVLIFHRGPALRLAAIIGYGLVGTIVVNLWRTIRGGGTLSHQQGRLLFLACLIPVASNLVYLVDMPYFNGVDWTSLTFSISGLFFLMALYGPRFLDLAPIARQTMIEHMSDAVLVLDTTNYIIDFNQAARALWDLNNHHLGAALEASLTQRPEIIALAKKSDATRRREAVIYEDQGQVYDTRLTPLADKRTQLYGKLIVSRNITNRYEIEQALHERVKELKGIYDLTLLIEKPNISLDEILQGSVGIIAAAMQHPHLAYTRLTLANKVYSTPNYRDTNQKLIQDITVAGRGVGLLEVGYLAKPAEDFTFLEEERNLIFIMAERIGNTIENFQADRALHESENLLRTIAENYPNSFLSVIEADFTVGFTAGQEFQKQNLDPNQFFGLGLEDVFGEHTPTVRQYYEQTFQGEEQAFELFINDQYQLYRTVPLYSQNGSIHRILSVVENITNRKQLETELQDQQRALAAVEERQRLARDLHDSVNQSIHSTVLFSETLTAVLKKDNPKRATQIAARLQESARQAIKEVRLMLYELQEGSQTGADLLENLDYRLNSVERRAGVHTEVIVAGALEHCPSTLHQDMFWIIIEALNNALKHAQARQIKIRIQCMPQQIQLEVADDGVGFEFESLRAGGLGLSNMHERAELLGGQLTIDSTPSQGTRIHLDIDPGRISKG